MTESLQTRIAALKVPDTDISLGEAKARIRIVETAGRVVVELVLGFPCESLKPWLQAEVSRIVAADGGELARLDIQQRIATHAVQPNVSPLANVRNLVAIASGKGGVGKSTTAVNLALALAAEGARVGVLDADIYGPSIPMMLGLSGRPDSPDGKSIEPMRAHGIQAMSIGLLIEQDTPMIWRGPMATSALTQLLNDTRWDDLDYLIVDLPPGTGDIQLTTGAEDPGRRRGDRDDAPGRGHARRAQGAEDVREGGRSGAGPGREHGRPRLLELRPRRAHLRRGRRRVAWRPSTACRCSAACRWRSRSVNRVTSARPL